MQAAVNLQQIRLRKSCDLVSRVTSNELLKSMFLMDLDV